MEALKEVQDDRDADIHTPPPDFRKSPTVPSLQERSGTSSRNVSSLRPFSEEGEQFAAHLENPEKGSFRLVSLNLGGRNSNPLEFELKGDSSETAGAAVMVLRKAGKALRCAQEGPLLMPASERKLVEEILAEVFERTNSSEERAQVRKLLQSETWALALARVKEANVHFFNALNLGTLKLGRPSVWEDPTSCMTYSTMSDYLLAWLQWYRALDRTGKFWLEEAPRVAAKRGLEVGTAFAGVLLFDVMCLCTARYAMKTGPEQEPDIAEDEREVQFNELARFAGRLPASSLTKKHLVAKNFAIAMGAHAILLQESNRFVEQPTIKEEYMPPFKGLDGITKIFLRKGSFDEVTNITAALAEKMEELLDAKAGPQLQKAWRLSTTRMAGVYARCAERLGGFQVCLVSLHCAKSSCTGDYIEALRGVLADYNAELYVVATDSNCSTAEAEAFQRRLSNAGIEVGCDPKQQQVTVAKQRTAFQTQVEKIGETDISHKDYILSWTSPDVRRGPTSYTPDLRTPYGVEQETRQCVRLPTTHWPFDHCGVSTSFQRRSRCSERVRCTWSLFCSFLLVGFIFSLFVLPLASPDGRSNPYGQPGDWYPFGRENSAHSGICEARLPCKEGWLHREESCYLVTPRLQSDEVDALCRAYDGTPVVIGSEQENQFITQHLCPEGDFCYIGLQNDFDGKDSWWVSGEVLNYTRLVPVANSATPLFPNSRASESKSTLLSSMPGEVSGCQGSLSFPFRALDSVDGDWVNVAAALAMAVSGGCLLLPRPPQQHAAFWVLRLSFAVNVAWYLQRILVSCFTNDYSSHQSVLNLGNLADWYGHNVVSLLSLWLVIKRVTLLCPGRGLLALFGIIIWDLLFSMVPNVLWIDASSTLRPSWSVVLVLCCSGVIFLGYAALGLQLCKTLHHAWVVMKREATIGQSSQGSRALDEGARAAKLQFFSVCAAIGTGALRVLADLGCTVSFMLPVDPMWAVHAYMLASFFDSVTNDACVYLLAVLNMDAAVVRAKGVTAEVAERAGREVEQHALAVRMLTAAPTSAEQLSQLARLEQSARDAIHTEQENHAFLILQSAIRVESARIHRLMKCVRLRAMTMPVRYAHLIDILPVEGLPRQHVPQHILGAKTEEAAEEYFQWIYAEATGAQQVLFRHVQQLLAKFNKTPWPSDLGLAQEEFPWTIWAHGPQNIAIRPLPKGEVISPGDILLHVPRRRRRLEGEESSSASAALCFVLEEETGVSGSHVRIHRSGKDEPEEVPRRELRSCSGSGVFVPGPKKKEQRCRDKIQADYAGYVEFPAAASLVDICRCQILLDDPYALAVFVAYLRKTSNVVRLKNRFNEDVLETLDPEELQSIFYGATDNSETQTIGSTTYATDYQYRDVAINLEITSPSGVPFICEVQVTLTNLAVLKHADQNIYTVRRMKSPSELLKSHVFASDRKASVVKV